ncbi:hypothetical protein NDU88_009783 [Pleurodeles waltl]|uniref:Gypsy retrotransposon integrase-like protein 1 n=1 Tax=Pleurodeles waltl TaxID=8319 RepID=A0AAV7PTE5_PLEWA|nr:hypothetical protein NDU88_009783 [Pleurodeles waltl]
MEAVRSNNWCSLQHPASFCTAEATATLQALFHVRHELSVSEDESLPRGSCLVLSACLGHRAVLFAHSAHQVIVKSKNRLQRKVWFPGLDQQTEDVIKGCLVCQASRAPDPPAPVITEEGTTAPWQRVSTDFGSLPDMTYMLVVMVDYSRYPEVELVPSTAAHVGILKMENLMANYGLFGELRTDNRPSIQ